MIVWKSTLRAAEQAHATEIEVFREALTSLKHQLEVSEEHYQQIREDLRVVVGIKPRQAPRAEYPTADAVPPVAPPPRVLSPMEAATRGARTAAQFQQAAQQVLASEAEAWAKQQMADASKIIGAEDAN